MKLYDLDLRTFEITEIECAGLFGTKMYIKNGKRYALKTKHNDIFTNREMAVAKGSATPQEVLLEQLRDDIDEFREAQRRIDAQRKSR